MAHMRNLKRSVILSLLLYEVLSGNHRVIASREAGRVATLYALYAQKDLTT